MYYAGELSLTPAACNHIVATCNGAAVHVYLNGREDGKGKEVKLTIRKTSEPLRIGWLGSYGYFNGSVREVAIYRRAMDAGEEFVMHKADK